MACNCNEGNRYNIGMGCCVPVLAPIENYYTKSQVDKLIEDINVSGVTEEELDEKIASAKTEIENEIPTVPTSNTAFTNDAGYLTEHQSLDGYATEEYVNSQISSQTADFVSGEELSSFTYDKSTIDSKIAQGGSFDPSLYYDKTATDALLDEKLDASAYTPTDLSNYYNKSEVDNKIASAKSEVEGEIPSLSGYATEQWVLDKNYISGVDLSNYATKQEIPTVPTNVSAFNNDVPYLTQHQSLSAYSTTQEVNNLINQSVSGKASQSDLETVSGDVNTLNSDAVTSIRITTVSTQKEVHIEQARLNDGYSNAGIIYKVGSGLTFDITTKKIAVDSSVIAQKSDLSNYYNKTEVDNKLSSKPNVWCGNESEWSQISGSTESGTIYLVY